MFRSAGFRFIVVGLLALLMFIPLNLVSGVVQERAHHSDQTVAAIGDEWGGAQLVSGPLLMIPVTEEVTYARKREAVDPVTGRTLRDARNNIVYEHFDETVVEPRAPVYLYPGRFDADIATRTQTRHRGIFAVPVFTAELVFGFDFDTGAAAAQIAGKERLDWAASELRVFFSSNRGLRGEARLVAGGAELGLEPIPAAAKAGTGIVASTGDPRDLGEFELRLAMNGAGELGVAAVGRTSRVTMTSDWPDPGFFGNFLPDASEITGAGFAARWTVPHLARSLPQAARENPDSMARQQATMMVRYLTPNDFYQKAWRSARYGILFIALTFLTILLLDRASDRPAHPVQYLMVGLSQSVFVLLMVAYAEQIGFGPAYLVAAGATVGLLVFFGATALRLGRRATVLGAMLVTVYLALYLILRSADYALLAGATLAFAALALTMWVTRNEDWHRAGIPGGWPFRKRIPGGDPVAAG